MIGIYKITNLINNKVYVGQTTRDLNLRMNGHKSNANIGKSLPLYDAMREFGYNNFKIELIEECSYDQLNEREIYWINKLKSTLDEYGYNNALGGNNNQRVTDVLFNYYLEIINLLKNTNLSFAQIADNYNVDRTTIHLINQGKRWFQKDIDYPIRKPKLKKVKEIKSRITKLPPREILKKIMEDNDYNKVAVSKLYGVSGNTVKKWCIKYELPYKKERVIKQRKILHTPKEIWMLDKVTKEVVKIFNSIREANLYFGSKYNDNNISRCVRGIRNSAHGYKWEFKY